MKKSIFSALCLVLLATTTQSAWGAEVTYTVSSTSAVTTSGTAPSGSSATYSQTYNTKCQMTKGNSCTLTLQGYSGVTISSIKLSMKSNKSAGAGGLKYSTDGGTTYTDIVASGTTFNKSNWNGSYTTSYTDVIKSVSITGTSSDLVLNIYATTNSLFCQSYTITYETGSTPPTLYLGLFLAAFVAVRACVRRVECLYATFHHIIMSKIDFRSVHFAKECFVCFFSWFCVVFCR